MNPHMSLNEQDDLPILGEKLTKEDVLVIQILNAAKKIHATKPEWMSPGVSVAAETAPLITSAGFNGTSSSYTFASPRTRALCTYSPFFKTIDEIGDVMDDVFGKNEWMIAGGCVRDALLCNSIKDIDVFVRGKTKVETVENVMKMVGGKAFKCHEGYYGNAFHVADISGSTCGYPIQIISIGKESLRDHLKSFGANLSKVSCTTDGLFISREFQEDANNHTITVNGVKGETRLDAYIQRISKKYPDFRVV